VPVYRVRLRLTVKRGLSQSVNANAGDDRRLVRLGLVSDARAVGAAVTRSDCGATVSFNRKAAGLRVGRGKAPGQSQALWPVA